MSGIVWTEKVVAAMKAEVQAAIESGVPFSILCNECDAGMDIGGIVQAVSEGWINISFDPEGLSNNFLGDCPDCVRDEEAAGTLFAGANA